MMYDYVTTRSSSPVTTVLGHGASSTVVLVKDANGRRSRAIKHFRASVSESALMNELQILVRLNHPCILQIYGFVLPSKTEQAEIHMEWASNGSLSRVMKLVHSPQCPIFWNPTGIAIIICGIVLGMRFMHSRGFIHQDLKPSNILLSEKGRVLISDFGSSRNEYVDITPTAAGTVQYAAPELFQDLLDPTRKVDVYSFGLILYELLVGRMVFPDDEPQFPIIRKKRSGYIPPIGRDITPAMKILIEKCLQLNADDRPSFDDILATFEKQAFAIVQEADQRTVSAYVLGIRDWESSHPCSLPLLSPDSLRVGEVEPPKGLMPWV
jgi:serine/threonine protein kinase